MEEAELSESLSEGEIKILSNLQLLERYSVQESYKKEDQLKIRAIVVETVLWVKDSIESSDIELPLQILKLLEFIEKVKNSFNFSERSFKLRTRPIQSFLLNKL